MNLYRYNTLLVILIGLFCYESATAQTLKIATLVPEGSKWMFALKTAGAEIEAQTDGRVKLKLYGGGVQGSDQNVIRKIRVGQLHGFTTTGGGLSALHRDAGLYSLPLVFNNVEEATYVRARMDGHLRQAPLRIEDRARHALVQTVLEHALGQRGVQPRGNEALGLRVTARIGACGQRKSRHMGRAEGRWPPMCGTGGSARHEL